MNKQAVVSKFSHVKPGDTEFKGGGLRDFFLYRDLGIADATGGQVICHLVKANPDLPPEEGTGWHRHDCEFQIVIMTKGWARFMYEDRSTLVQAGDVVHQRPGITHYLYDYSEDMEYLEIVSPADFKTIITIITIITTITVITIITTITTIITTITTNTNVTVRKQPKTLAVVHRPLKDF